MHSEILSQSSDRRVNFLSINALKLLMDIGKKDGQDNIILKIALSTGGILGGIYAAKNIITSDIIGVIIVIAVIVGILIIFKNDIRSLQIIKKLFYKPVLPVIWNVPHHHNPNFTGREIYLKKLQSMLYSDQSDARKVAICGLGGVGKTQLAIEYCYRNKNKYRTIWWVRSESQETLASDYADLAAELDLPAKAKGYTDQSVVIKAVKHWLEHNSRWLLIFDNAQCQVDLMNYLPQVGNGHTIITSRNQFWDGVVKPLEVMVFDRAESIDFICWRTGQNDKRAAETLAEKLGDLPLALEQASAYIERTRITLPEYLRLFKIRRKELIELQPPPTDYPHSVATTWSLSMDRVREESPVAADLLNLCAFLAPDKIPLKLFCEGKKYLPKSLAATVSDPLALNSSIEALRRYSLIDVSGKLERTLSIHRIVQTVIQHRLENSDIWVKTALRILSNAFPIKSDDPESIDMQKWHDCSLLLPHALAASQYDEVAPELTSNILNQSGSYLREISDLHKAKELHEKALRLAGNIHGENYHCVAICHENFGRVLRDIGELKMAKEHYEKALKIYEAFYDSKHPHLAICEDGLGRVLFEMNELEAAREHLERALKIDEVIHGPNHFKIAIRLNNIGAVLHNQGNLIAAKEHYEKAIKIDEAFYGISHPYVAIRLNNIGTVLHDQGNLIAAKEHYEKAIKIDEAFYGLDDIHITTSLNNLGCVLQDMGNLKGAKVNFIRAKKILEKVYDPDNPEIAKLLCNLGYLLLIRGDIEEAKKYYERAAQIFHNSLGEDHPKTLTIRENLELLKSRQAGFLLSLFHPMIHKTFMMELWLSVNHKIIRRRF